MSKNVEIKDQLGKTTKVGDTVVVLVKTYGCKCLTDAQLRMCVYNGLGEWGFEFKDAFSSHYIKQPQFIKV